MADGRAWGAVDTMQGPPRVAEPDDRAQYQPHAAKWVDEALTAVLIAPVPMALLGGSHLVSNGMKALDDTPLWYQVGLVTLFAFVYGTRALRGARDVFSIMPHRST